MATEEQTNTGITLASISSGNSRAGQRLTVSSRIISKLSFHLLKNGSPTGDVTFTIRKVSDNSIINSKVWGDASALPTARAWKEATFVTPVLINEEVRILVEFSGGGGSDYVGISGTLTDVKADESFTTFTTFWTDYDGGATDYDSAYIYTYTTPVSPTVTTQTVTAISGTTATGNGNITSLGAPNPTAHGVCWNTTGTPTTADSKTDEGAASTTGAFTTAMTGLTAGVKYYVRAYATNTEGTGYGGEVVFWADKGTVFPTDAITRVTNLIHRYNRDEGVYTLELSLGEVTTDFGLPEWASTPRTLAINQENAQRESEIARVVRETLTGSDLFPGEVPPGGGIGPRPDAAARRRRELEGSELFPGEVPPGGGLRPVRMTIGPAPSISERASQFIFPGFTAPGQPVNTDRVTEERPMTLVRPGVLDRAVRMFDRLRGTKRTRQQQDDDISRGFS